MGAWLRSAKLPPFIKTEVSFSAGYRRYTNTGAHSNYQDEGDGWDCRVTAREAEPRVGGWARPAARGVRFPSVSAVSGHRACHMHRIWLNAYSTANVLAFSTTLVERVSALGDIVFNYLSPTATTGGDRLSVPRGHGLWGPQEP